MRFENMKRGALGSKAGFLRDEAVGFFYANLPDAEVGVVLAQRLTAAELQPFSIEATIRTVRQLQVFHHLSGLTINAMGVPLRQLAGDISVLVAVCSERHSFYHDGLGTSHEDNAPQALRVFYGAALAGEVLCHGTHMDVCARCMSDGEPDFTRRLMHFLETLARGQDLL
jgi:hypothetical protein